MGLSRDDYTKFQQDYQDRKIFAADPFAVLDQEGVGKLVKMAVDLGRKTNPKLEIGICGARRRAEFGAVLLPDWHELRFLLTVPCTDCAAGGGTGGHQRRSVGSDADGITARGGMGMVR